MKRVALIAALTLSGLLAAGCDKNPTLSNTQTKVAQVVDDSTITTRVKARFAEDTRVSALRISVETQNGTVQLTGTAATQAEKDQATAVARAVPDVKEVRNNVVVRPAN